MDSLFERVHKCFCSGQRPVSGFEVASEKLSIGFLIPPNIGHLILYRNSGALSVTEMTAWPYYIQMEDFPALTKQQGEIAWTQLKMSGCRLGTDESILEIKAIKFHSEDFERALSE